MYDGIVSLDSYAPGYLNGFGSMSTSELNELQKALETTGALGTGQPGDGSPLRVQSLDSILKVVTFTTDYLKLWRNIGKLPAYNTVEEFNQLTNYGGRAGAFIGEGALPNAQDSTYVRQTATVKFLATTRIISHPMTLVQSAVGDVIARYTEDGTIWLLEQLTRAMYWADSAMNTLEFDGLYKQITSQATGGNVFDKRGADITPDDIENSAVTLYQNYAKVRDVQAYMPPGVATNFARQYMPYQRASMTEGTWSGWAGVPFEGWVSQYGPIPFVPDIFIAPASGGAPILQNAPSGSPSQPGTAITAAVASNSNSQFNSVTPGGTFYYAYSAENAAGESQVSGVSASVSVTNGDAATLTLTRVTSNPAATAYRIYRGTKSDGSDLKFMKRVADPGTGTTFTYVDENADIPGTGTVFLLDMDPAQAMVFKQLAPLMKMDLATIDTTYRFALLLYGTPVVYAPNKHVIFKNVNTTVTTS